MTVTNPAIMQAVERLGYRVTVGDVATQAGLNVNIVQQELLQLAAVGGGHLEVAQTGDMVYLFPRNFRQILRNKFLKLRIEEWWEKIWGVLFWLIRISFGLVLIISLILVVLAIFLVVMAASARDNDDRGDNDSSGGGGFDFLSGFLWFGSDWYWLFYPNYYDYSYSRYYEGVDEGYLEEERKLNFLEAVFSFLFGDGNPNAKFEERRYQEIAGVIRANQGVVIAEQVAPFLDDLGRGYYREYEEYMLPILARFNGIPEVSEEGGIIYRFPDLQIVAAVSSNQSVADYLVEDLWVFSQATSGQIMSAIGLGSVYLIACLSLGSILTAEVALQLGGLVGFVYGIYWFLLVYAIAFLTVPLIRYFWVNNKNGQINKRNEARRNEAKKLQDSDPVLEQKLAYAREFATEKVIGSGDIIYTSERELLEQEVEQKERLDKEWEERLEG